MHLPILIAVDANGLLNEGISSLLRSQGVKPRVAARASTDMGIIAQRALYGTIKILTLGGLQKPRLKQSKQQRNSLPSLLARLKTWVVGDCLQNVGMEKKFWMKYSVLTQYTKLLAKMCVNR